MTALKIEAIKQDRLPQVAEYVTRSPAVVDDSGPALAATEAANLAKLRWRLVDNPCRRHDEDMGLCLLDNAGRIKGILLQFPVRYRLDGQRLIGLASASFFVDPDVRLQGFFMFRRYLSTAGVDFYFATSCNDRSAALWDKVGASAVPDSDREFLLPLRSGPLVEELAVRRGLGRAGARVARWVGAAANPVLRTRLGRAYRDITPECDWDRLADLSDRNIAPGWLAVERTTDYLRWRLDACPDARATATYRFRTDQGGEGWFALRYTRRGKNRQIRACTLLDLVPPCNDFDMHRLLGAVRNICAPYADAIILRCQTKRFAGFDGVRVRPHAHSASTTYIKGRPPLEGRLAQKMDFLPGDGDTMS